MTLSKIQRKNCVCNIFFTFVTAVAVFATILVAQGQTTTNLSPFLQSASGVTHPIPLLITANPALISKVESWGIAATFSPSPFGIAELGYADLLATYRFSKRSIGGIGISGGGTASLYNEFHGILLSAVDIGEEKDITLGAAGEYSQISLNSFGTQRQFQLHLGISMQIGQSITAAAALGNILRSAFGKSDIIYQEARFGLGIIASPQWAFDTDIRIAERGSIEAGALFAPTKGVKIRLGYSSFLQSAELFPAFVISGESQIFSRLQWNNSFGFSQQIGISWIGL